MSLADAWHDPEGPEPLRGNLGDGDLALEVIHQGIRRVWDEAFIKAARAAGLSEDYIETILEASQA